MGENTEKEDNKVTFEFYIMYNWKKPGQKPKIYKHDPGDKEGPYNIVEKVQRTIKKPDTSRFKSEGEIEISQGKIEDMAVEEL